MSFYARIGFILQLGRFQLMSFYVTCQACNILPIQRATCNSYAIRWVSRTHFSISVWLVKAHQILINPKYNGQTLLGSAEPFLIVEDWLFRSNRDLYTFAFIKLMHHFLKYQRFNPRHLGLILLNYLSLMKVKLNNSKRRLITIAHLWSR